MQKTKRKIESEVAVVVNKFGIEVKRLRRKRRITQRTLAERVGVDFTYISKIENGQLRNFPSSYTIGKIAEALEADAERLILLAGKVPEQFQKIILSDELAVRFLSKLPTINRKTRTILEELLQKDIPFAK